MTKATDLQHWHEHQDWLEQLQADHPGCEIELTCSGANIHLGDDIVEEYEYEQAGANR